MKTQQHGLSLFYFIDIIAAGFFVMELKTTTDNKNLMRRWLLGFNHIWQNK